MSTNSTALESSTNPFGNPTTSSTRTTTNIPDDAKDVRLTVFIYVSIAVLFISLILLSIIIGHICYRRRSIARSYSRRRYVKSNDHDTTSKARYASTKSEDLTDLCVFVQTRGTLVSKSQDRYIMDSFNKRVHDLEITQRTSTDSQASELVSIFEQPKISVHRDAGYRNDIYSTNSDDVFTKGTQETDVDKNSEQPRSQNIVSVSLSREVEVANVNNAEEEIRSETEVEVHLKSSHTIPHQPSTNCDQINHTSPYQPSTNCDQINHTIPYQPSTSGDSVRQAASETKLRDTDFTKIELKQQVLTKDPARVTKMVNIQKTEIPSTNFLNGYWKFREVIGLQNLEVPIERSGVKLSFCEGNFKVRPSASFTLCGSIHTDVAKLSTCLDIEDDRMLVSPVPEFHVGKDVMLDDYAISEIPVCIPVITSSLKVHWMGTDKSKPKTIRDVPIVKSPLETDADVFYIIPEDRNTCVHVYTRHFSLFYCTACKVEIRFKLETEIYTREGSLQGFQTLHIKMPLLGPYDALEDCREERKRRMEDIDFRRIDRGKINILPTEQKTGLKFRLKPPPNWVHETVNNQDEDVIYDEEQSIDETPSIDCVNKLHLLQDDGDIQWKIKCQIRFRGNLGLTVDIINFLQSDHNKSKGSRIHTEFEIKCQHAGSRGSDDEYCLPNHEDPLRRLVIGLGSLRTRGKLLEMLGETSNIAAADSQDLLVKILTEIRNKDSKLFLTNVSMALAEMQVTCNENISYFFLHVDRPGTLYPKKESDQLKVTTPPHHVPTENYTSKTYLKVLVSSELKPHSDDRHPVENSDVESGLGHSTANGYCGMSLPSNISKGPYHTVSDSSVDGDETNPKSPVVQQETQLISSSEQSMVRSGSGAGATGNGVQWVQPSSAALDVSEMGNGYISRSESGIYM